MRVFEMNRIKKSELLYITALLLFITQEYIETSRYVDYFGYTIVAALKWGAVLLFLMSIVQENRFKKKIIVIAIVFFVMFAVLFVTTSRYNLLIILVILIASRDYNVKYVVSIVYKISLFYLVFIIASSIIGIIPNTTIIQADGERLRQTLGFDYVSFAFNYFTNILLCRIYLKTPVGLVKKKTMKWGELFIWIGASVLLYYLTRTNLTFIVSMFAIFLYIVFVKFKWFREIHSGKYSSGFWMWVYPVCFVITFYACFKYNPLSSTWAAINQLANNRLMLSNEAIYRYGINLFGTIIDMNNTALGSTNVYIDSGYMQLIILYGIILTIVFLITYMLMIRWAIKQKDTGLFIWLLCVAVFNVVNSMTFDLLFNSSLLAIWVLITYRHNSIEMVGIDDAKRRNNCKCNLSSV